MAAPAAGRAGDAGALPRWLTAPYALAAGAALVLVTLVVAFGFLRFERDVLEHRELAHAQLYARMLEDHADRTLNTVDVVLKQVAARVQAERSGAGAADALDEALRQSVAGLPFLRSLSLLDADLRIVASSSAANLGVSIPQGSLSIPVDRAVDRASNYLPGRDLVDLLAAPVANQRRGFIPWVRRLAPGDRAGYLVAVLNPDFFANAHSLALGDSGYRSVMATFDAQVLSVTPELADAVPNGSRLTSHWVFQHFLPKQEHGDWIGRALAGEASVAAFRSVRLLPWVVAVERPYHLLQAELAATRRGVASVTLAACTVIIGLSLAAWRSLTGHAEVRRQLDRNHRRVEQALAEAKQANAAKTEFLANITHELRTPLQSIIGFAELGLDRCPDAPRLHGMFDRIHGAGDRMLTLVNRLLDLSRLEADRPLHRRLQPLRPLMEGVLDELQPLAARRALQWSMTPAPMPGEVTVDEAAFSQVLRNVLANAVRFAPQGSTIELSTGERPGGGCEIRVRDQGPGIPPDELEAIFDAFVQSSRTKDGSGGTGLGLAICRRIMTAHGGSITAANHLQGGAVFTIQLPAGPASPAPNSAQLELHA